ncbi:hypothetical protein ABNP34_16240 (plasmid) [Glutamicibacter mishrai]|uniref:hypothetical protein n=1 Tax=Glutamicibacter mishrai TaxID=1775880 RepID=UPI0032EFDB81
MSGAKGEGFLYERLEAIQSMIFPPTTFDGKIEKQLNLSEEFVDSYVITYGILDEMLAMLASSRTTYSEVIAFWKAIASETSENDHADDYALLKKSEFGRTIIHMVGSVMHLK